MTKQLNTAASQTSKQLTVRDRCMKFLQAVLLMFAGMITLIYGLIFAVNFITQFNPANFWTATLVSVLCYGLVAITFTWICIKFGQALYKAFAASPQLDDD